MFRKIDLFLVVSCFAGLSASQGAGGAGGAGGPPEPTYVLNFASSIFVDSDPISNEAFNTSSLDVVSHNDTHSTIDGIMFIKKDLPPCGFLIEVEAYKETNGKLELVLTKKICDLCEELHDASENWKYIRYFGLPPKCPFPPGTYKVAGFAPDKEDLPMNASSSGVYFVIIKLFYNPDCDCDKTENKEFIACMKMSFSVESV